MSFLVIMGSILGAGLVLFLLVIGSLKYHYAW
jgi:hypothetical protein